MEKTEKKSAKKRITSGSVVDIAIILLLVLAVASIGYRIYKVQNPTVSDTVKEYELMFRVENVSFLLPNYFRVGDEVRFTETGVSIGTLLDQSNEEGGSAFSVTAATVLVTDDSGNLIKVSYPDSSRVDATGALLVKGTKAADGTFLLNGTESITPGETVRISTEKADVTVVVSEIHAH